MRLPVLTKTVIERNRSCPSELNVEALMTKKGMKMKKALSSVLIVGVVLMTASMAMAAKPGPCLPDPPVNLICTASETGVDLSWDMLTGATKYSVDVEVNDGVETFEQSFSSDTNSLSVAFTEFENCGTATAKVKGLNPPQKGACSQNNAWSVECVFEVDCPEEPLP